MRVSCGCVAVLAILGCTAEPTIPADSGLDADNGDAVSLDATSDADSSTDDARVVVDAAQDADVAMDASLDTGVVPVDTGVGDARPLDAALPDAGPEPCTTPDTIETLPCGTCGTVNRICDGATMLWTYGSCVEHGVCTPGATATVSCGRCGSALVTCDASCGWSAGACAGETGSCTPGARRELGTCTGGASRVVTCGSSCVETAGACEAAECAAGATMTVGCGYCGHRTRTCDALGRWLDGTCTGGRVCAPGSTQTEPCAGCGTRTSTCNASCVWSTGSCVGGVTCPAPPAPVCVGPTTLRTTTASGSCAAGSCTRPTVDRACPGGCVGGVCYVLERGLGGAAGFGPNRLGTGDDVVSGAIDLSALGPLRFYDATHTSAYVSNNGNITFDAAVSFAGPVFPYPGTSIIAAWFADVDTRGTPARPGEDAVYWSLTPQRFVATWYRVGFAASHVAPANSFQIIVTPRPDVALGDFDVELRYEQCRWTTGDASGGSGGLGDPAAVAGFGAADGVRSLLLPGSGSRAILDLCDGSNAGTPGVWRYRVRAGQPS